jgi:folate-binding protein YgfZ
MENMNYSTLNDRAIISITGPDKLPFLQGIITNSIYKVNDETAIYSLFLTPQGKFLSDLFIVKQKDNFYLDVPKASKDNMISKLKMYRLRSKVEIEDISSQMQVVAFPEDNSLKLFNLKDLGHTKDFLNGKVFVDPRSKRLGLRAFVRETIPNNYNENNDLYDLGRIKNTIPEGYKDLQPEKSFPLEYGMDNLNAIDFNKGCYVGQELTARTKYQGIIRKQVMQIEGDVELPPYGTEITINGTKIGFICSTYGKVGLALIRLEGVKKAGVNNAVALNCNVSINII